MLLADSSSAYEAPESTVLQETVVVCSFRALRKKASSPRKIPASLDAERPHRRGTEVVAG